MRAYQIDVDMRAGNPVTDIEWLTYGMEETCQELDLPGMELGKSVQVRTRSWRFDDTGASTELWWVRGPLQDWSFWDSWNGDNHCLWYRAYPLEAWGIADFFLRHHVPGDRCWRFDDPSPTVDTTAERRAVEEQWVAHARLVGNT